MIAGRPSLKHGCQFVRPRGVGRNGPSFRSGKKKGDGFEVFRVIGAEEKAGPAPGPFGGGLKKVGLNHTVLVMPRLWPWVRKQDPNLLEGDAGRERLEKRARFTLQEGTVEKLRPGAFLLGAEDALTTDINSNTGFGGVRSGIAHQKMAMTTADLQDKALRASETFFERSAQNCSLSGGCL